MFFLSRYVPDADVDLLARHNAAPHHSVVIRRQQPSPSHQLRCGAAERAEGLRNLIDGEQTSTCGSNTAATTSAALGRRRWRKRHATGATQQLRRNRRTFFGWKRIRNSSAELVQALDVAGLCDTHNVRAEHPLPCQFDVSARRELICSTLPLAPCAAPARNSITKRFRNNS